jgi:ATP-binding cassette, subfamily B, bacterial
MTATGDAAILRRLVAQARPFWGSMSILFVLEALTVPLTLLTPVPIKVAVDSALGDRPLPNWLDAVIPGGPVQSSSGALAAAVGLMVALGLAEYGRGLASWVLGAYTGERLALDFRARLLRQVQRLSLAYHDARGTTDSTYRIQYDAAAIQTVATDGLTPFLVSALTLGGMIVVTALIDWQLALAVLVAVPALAVLMILARRRLRQGWLGVKEMESSAMSVVQEVLGALRVVKVFGREAHEESRFVERATGSVRGHVRLAWLEGLLWVAIGMTLVSATAFALLLGVNHVRSGAITLGELLIVMAYLANITGPLETMAHKLTDLQNSLASAQRAFAVLDEAPEVPERPDASPLPRAHGAIRFEGVTFSYDGREPAVEDVWLAMPAGATVGVAGATGAGKTTLVGLLNRFYDPDEGRITLDGVDLRDYRLADLRNQFAIVLQEPVLFSTSIAENIAYARADASRQEVEGAAQAANAHDFIERLPAGYETTVGERGAMLSGGQRQRISIARAFLKDAPILVLDEPTSAVDVATEASIMEAMDRLRRGRTTLMITHRPELLARNELVVRLEGGRVSENAADPPARRLALER